MKYYLREITNFLNNNNLLLNPDIQQKEMYISEIYIADLVPLMQPNHSKVD